MHKVLRAVPGTGQALRVVQAQGVCEEQGPGMNGPPLRLAAVCERLCMPCSRDQTLSCLQSDCEQTFHFIFRNMVLATVWWKDSFTFHTLPDLY